MFICPSCHKTFTSLYTWTCSCGHVVDLDFTADFTHIDKESLSDKEIVDAATPFMAADEVIQLGQTRTPVLPLNIEGQEIWIKQDHLMPSGSYKDRGAALLISFLAKKGVTHVVEDSSGNAGAAIAAFCAQAGISCDIYVPAQTSPGKLKQIQAYGARLVKIHGTRQDTADAVAEAAAMQVYASHVYNPFFLHGTKFFAYELYQQMSRHKPDTLILPAGNGTLLLGAWLGFKELWENELISHIPKLIAVQAANCAPLHAQFHGHTDVPPATTIAEGIAIANPARAGQMLEAVRSTHGTFLKVTEDEIESSWQDMAKRGFYIEPTSAAVIAGVRQYIRTADTSEKIASVFTGHGLKK